MSKSSNNNNNKWQPVCCFFWAKCHSPRGASACAWKDGGILRWHAPLQADESRHHGSVSAPFRRRRRHRHQRPVRAGQGWWLEGGPVAGHALPREQPPPPELRWGISFHCYVRERGGQCVCVCARQLLSLHHTRSPRRHHKRGHLLAACLRAGKPKCRFRWRALSHDGTHSLEPI